MQYTDETPMPFGKYKGTILRNVPASYLIWVYNNFDGLYDNFKKYIKTNMHILELEVIKEKQKRKSENI